MDNQHGTLRLAWLAGIVDGEGSIMVIRATFKGRHRYHHRMSIANTGLPIIDKARSILDEHEIKYGLYTQDRGKDGLRRRKTYLIHIMRADSIRKILPLLMPFLTEKLERAQKLNEAMKVWPKLDKPALWADFKAMNERVPR